MDSYITDGRNPEKFRFATLATHCSYPSLYLYDRKIGALASDWLSDSTFESGLPEQYRRLAALSLETIKNNGYLLRRRSDQALVLSSMAFLLESKRPANACLCISFFEPSASQERRRLLSLLLYNEFQMPLGIYSHKDNLFIMYRSGSQHAEDVSLFQRECGVELVQNLIRLDQRYHLESRIDASNNGHVLTFGFNKSFGHANWNDVLGCLHLRRLSKSHNLGIPQVTLVGKHAWINPLDLLPGTRVRLASVDESAQYTIEAGLLLHVPIGFCIDEEYEKFWKYEVTAELDIETKSQLRLLRQHCWPIVSLNLRFEEWWRRPWYMQKEQVLDLVRSIKYEFPNVGLIVDSMTAYHPRVCGKLPVSNAPRKLIQQLQECASVVDISGAYIASKAAAYQIVDYSITQFGSGDTIPSWVYDKPSSIICGEPQLIEIYSSPDSITRACKRSLRDNSRIGSFIPADMIRITETGFSLDFHKSCEHIMKCMRQALSV